MSIAFGTGNAALGDGNGNAQLKVTNVDGTTNRSEMALLTWDGSALKEHLRLLSDGALVTGNSLHGLKALGGGFKKVFKGPRHTKQDHIDAIVRQDEAARGVFFIHGQRV